MPAKKWSVGDRVEALEPVNGREWIPAVLLDVKQKRVQFLGHCVWAGCVFPDAVIRQLSRPTPKQQPRRRGQQLLKGFA